MIEQGRMTEAGLAVDKEAERKFKGLTPSPKKQNLDWMASAKKEETRQQQIKEILKMVQGTSDVEAD